MDRCQIIGYSRLSDSTYADLSSDRSYTEAAQLSREYSSCISPSSAGWGLSGFPYAFSVVFIAEEIDGIWDKGPEDTHIVDVQTLLEAFLKCPWDLPLSLMRFSFGTIQLCIFIVMFMYSYCYVCSVLYILFHCANWHSSAILTEVFPCLFLSCKANCRE